jgi:hypothetical protein
MTGERRDITLNGILIFVAVLTAGSLIMLIIALPAIFSSRNNSDAVRRGNELAACRSEFNAEVASAQDAVEDARAERDNLVIYGLAATATGDDDALTQLVEQTPAAVEAIERARAVKTQAVEAYAAAVRKSRDEPAEFLAECEGG